MITYIIVENLAAATGIDGQIKALPMFVILLFYLFLFNSAVYGNIFFLTQTSDIDERMICYIVNTTECHEEYYFSFFLCVEIMESVLSDSLFVCLPCIFLGFYLDSYNFYTISEIGKILYEANGSGFKYSKERIGGTNQLKTSSNQLISDKKKISCIAIKEKEIGIHWSSLGCM